MRVIALFSLLLSVLLVSCAAPETKKPANGVPKDLFLEIMTQKAPAKMCEDGRYAACLKISKARCEAEMSKVAAQCRDQLMKTMPDYLYGGEDGRKYGEEFGKCMLVRHMVGGGYDLESIKTCK